MSATPTRAAIYARISTKDKGQDTENQLRELREYAERSGWSVAAEYVDQASGKTANRDQYQALFADASKRKFEVVLVWALDRFTRQGVAETFARIKELLSHGVQFVSYSEAHFRTTGPAGELMIAIAAWIAEQERIRISERTKAGLATARAKGKTLGRPRIAVEPLYLQRLRAEGLSIRQIAAKVGMKFPTVHRILASAKQ